MDIFRLVIAFFLISASVSVQAQSPAMTHTYAHYGVRQGLVQSQVMCGFQDSFGYLWFGTKGGISRFDGKTFKNFRSDIEIKSGQIHYINQYKDTVFAVKGRQILFFHPDGSIVDVSPPDNYKMQSGSCFFAEKLLYLFNCYQNAPNESTYHYFIFDFENKTFTISTNKLPENIHCVLNTPEGVIAFNDKAMYKIDGTDSSLFHEIPLSGLSGRRFIKTSDTEFIVSEQQEGSLHYDTYRGAIRNGQLEKEFLYRSGKTVYDAVKLDEGTYYLSENRNYGSMLLKDGKVSPLSISSLHVYDAFLDRDRNLWLCSEEGVFNCFHLNFEAFTLGFGRNDFIWDIRKDVFGNIWTSSFGLGIWRTTPEYRVEKSEMYLDGKQVIDDGVNMNGCEDALHRLYFTCGYGLAVFDPRKGNNRRLTVLKTGVSLASYYDTLTNTVYAGGFDDSGYLLNAINEEFKIKSYGFNLGHIISICRDANRRLRIGTFNGGAYLDEEKGQIVTDTLPRAYNSIISMVSDKEGILWLATFRGLYAEHKDGKQTEVQAGRYAFVCNYHDRWLLFGGVDNVLHILDLQKYHRDGNACIRSFDHYNGYDALEGGQNGSYTDPDGYVWTIGGDKVLRFRPGEIMDTPPVKQLKPFIGAVYHANKDLDWQLIKRGVATLEAEQNNLRFDILQASISTPDKLKFRYRLNGYFAHWIETAGNTVIFQNIPYKEFTLEIQSSTDGQNWTDSVFSGIVTIKKPFFLSGWGILLISIVVLLISSFLSYIFYKNRSRKKEKEHKMEQLRNRAVKSKYIPHFTGNVLNSINYLVEKDKELAQRYISEFAGFNRQTMLNTEKLGRSLSDELEYTEQYLRLEKLRFEDKLEYSIYVDPAIDVSVTVPVMLLHTFCENAVKHGFRHKNSTGHLKIEVYKENSCIIMAVEDDGIGRTAAKKKNTAGTGEGLSIIDQQINFFNRYNKKKSRLRITDLYDDEGSPAGTRFEFHMPDGFIINP